MPKHLLIKKKSVSSDGFRYRGLERTRLENLTDTIFGFSITLLVIASEVPTTYIELQASMYSFIGFIFCILMLLGIWNSHGSFFLHYGLEDGPIKVLNSLFLFVLLFYVYPLKYLFSYLGTAVYLQLKLSFGDRSDAMKMVFDELNKSNLSSLQWEDIMIRFGLGLFCINMIFMLFHIFALKKRGHLKLNKREVYITHSFIQKYGIIVLITIVSMMIVLVFGGEKAPISGTVYALLPFILITHKKLRDKKLPNKKKKKGLNTKGSDVPLESQDDIKNENTDSTVDSQKES